MRLAKSVTALLAWMLLGFSTARAADTHQARADALRLHAEGRYREALPLFDAVLKNKPRDIESLNKRGCIYLRLNDPERAIPDFTAATNYSPFLDIDPRQANRELIPDVNLPLSALGYWSPQFYTSAFSNRGVALMMLGRDDEALADFRHVIDLGRVYRFGQYPSVMASSFCGMGQVHHRKGDDARAVDAFDNALRYNPNDPNIHVGRGMALAGLGQADDALDAYAYALRIDPNHSRAHAFRAFLFERLGRDDDAMAGYDAAIRLDPTWGLARRYRGAMLSKLGRNAEALAELTAAIRLDPLDSQAYKDRGGVYSRIADHTHALKDLDEAIRLDPTNAKAYQNRAASYNALTRFDRAVHDCDLALRYDPKNVGARNNRGVALTGLGRYAESIDDLTQTIRMKPDAAVAYLNRSGAFRGLGMMSRAESDREEALRLDPKLAMTPAGSRDLVKLRAPETTLEPLPRSDPDLNRRWRDEGDTLRKKADWAGAAIAYGHAFKADPADHQALAWRGWSRMIAGEPGAGSEARRWLDAKGWRDPFAPYMALLGVMASRREGKADAADEFLTEALANTRPPDWPSPVFRYLKRTLSSAEMIAAADAPDRQSEAHLVVGLGLYFRGEKTAARDHLRKAAELGSEHSIARALAAETLRRDSQ